MEPQERPIRNRFERHAITPGLSIGKSTSGLPVICQQSQ